MDTKPTTIINLYGGPGTGKSTSAAYIYFLLKHASSNAELVREYVKDWVWEGRAIKEYDQIYFLGKQIRREVILTNKVSHIVTDSPVLLSLYYARLHSKPEFAKGIETLVRSYYADAESRGVKHFHVFLKRSKPYETAGRYQTLEQAKEIDVGLKALLDETNTPYISSGTEKHDLETVLKFIEPPEFTQPPNCT